MPRFDFSNTIEGEQVHRSENIRWVEESFFAPGGEAEAPPRGIGVVLKRQRIRFFLVCILTLLTVYVSRVGYLQLHRGEAFAAIAEDNRIRTITERASRGMIVDRFDRPIVTNTPEFIMTITPQELPKTSEAKQTLIAQLADILTEDPLAVTEEISALPTDPFLRRQAQTFREDVPYETALRMIAKEQEMPGIRVEVREQRAYPETYDEQSVATPMPTSIAHIVGSLGKISAEDWTTVAAKGYILSDELGKSGIEQTYDTALHGTHGKRVVEVDALGKIRRILRREEPIAGERLMLTLDLSLQRIAEDALQKGMAALPKRSRTGGAVVAIDPRDGAIRALVSLPSYDARIFSGNRSRTALAEVLADPAQPLFPRAIAGAYPSGSTIKPLMSLAALEEGIITPNTSFLSTGGIRIGQWFFPDWRAGGHGQVSVRRAIADSINTFYYIIGGGYGNIPGLGMERIEKWLTKFSFGKQLGVDLPREAAGLVPTPEWKEVVKEEQWYIGDTYHLAIGQGDFLVTPLQIASMTATFANGGTLWRPHLRAREEPVALDAKVGSDANIRVVREGMRQGVTAGGSVRLNTLPIPVAGKTGTAQWSSKYATHAWFTGFAPYDNPELAITVLVEEGGEGSTASVPIAKEILEKYFAQQQKP